MWSHSTACADAPFRRKSAMLGSIAHGMTMDELVAGLARALAGRSRVVLAPADQTASAVLVPRLAAAGEPSLLFTRRSQLLPHHQGQVAFPGGRQDADDPDLAATAVRETEEEIGLPRAEIRLLGPIDDIETVST